MKKILFVIMIVLIFCSCMRKGKILEIQAQSNGFSKVQIYLKNGSTRINNICFDYDLIKYDIIKKNDVIKFCDNIFATYTVRVITNE